MPATTEVSRDLALSCRDLHRHLGQGEGRVHVLIENAPARSLAGPEREGSTPNLEALRPAGKP